MNLLDMNVKLDFFNRPISFYLKFSTRFSEFGADFLFEEKAILLLDIGD